MTRAQEASLRALLVDIANLADAAARCSAATFYDSPVKDAVKKHRRTDADVAVWLGRLDAAAARLEAARDAVPALTRAAVAG